MLRADATGQAYAHAVPVTVTVSSNPLPAPVAWLFTFVGAAMIVAGFTVIPPIPDVGSSNTLLTVIAALLVIPAWILFIVVMLRRQRFRDDVTVDVPDELPEPPSTHDPAVVATIIGDGSPDPRAVDGTVLELAQRKVISIGEYGEKVVVQITSDARGEHGGENLVLAELRKIEQPGGDVIGPPIWNERIGWWSEFRSDARSRATTAGLIETRIPFVALMLVMIFTATGASLLFFERIPVFVGSILLANGAPHLVARTSGYRLTDAGKRLQAAWRAFGRHLHRHGSFRDVGPAGVALWGPNLVYGAVLGVAERAADPLTPRVLGLRERQATEFTKVYDL